MLRTSKDGAELLPACDATLRGELTKGNLQEENWETSTKQENEVGYEKCTWVEGRKDGATLGKMNREKNGVREQKMKNRGKQIKNWSGNIISMNSKQCDRTTLFHIVLPWKKNIDVLFLVLTSTILIAEVWETPDVP